MWSAECFGQWQNGESTGQNGRTARLHTPGGLRCKPGGSAHSWVFEVFEVQGSRLWWGLLFCQIVGVARTRAEPFCHPCRTEGRPLPATLLI